jgi:hypothetical protein
MISTDRVRRLSAATTSSPSKQRSGFVWKALSFIVVCSIVITKAIKSLSKSIFIINKINANRSFNCSRFKPPDASYIELLRFRVRPPKNRELPLQTKCTFCVQGNRVRLNFKCTTK